MPGVKRTNKCSDARIRASRNWQLRNPDYKYDSTFDYKKYYIKNIERKREQANHYYFVKSQFKIYRFILIDYEF